MYHFVRDLQGSRFPEIKGLDAKDFSGQLEYIVKHYNVVRMEDVLATLDDPSVELPERSLLLTFDDGYADHYQTVFPLLDRLGIQGSFFPPARAILERRVLDVNKIHFLLAASRDKARLVRAAEERIEDHRAGHDLPSLSELRARFAVPNRFDTAEVVYLKRVLQHALPEGVRATIVDELFGEVVASDETAFANELYATLEQLRCMRRHGMYIGSHGYGHYWLDNLPAAEQETEVATSLEFLSEIGCDPSNWVMCYPYGAYDASLLEVLERHGCRAGLTTEVTVADLNASDRFELGRIDTNDLPRRGDAPINTWIAAA